MVIMVLKYIMTMMTPTTIAMMMKTLVLVYL